MKIAVEGCLHGELDKLYETIAYSEAKNGIKVDLVLVCGDFQAVRNEEDLACMACPDKYKRMNTFYKYYSGECVAPILTIFIGGNHEASNHMLELYYGGWVAPNIYYLGHSGVVNYRGVRIAGLSGIYKDHDFHKGYFEFPPFTEHSMRSVYHVRQIEILKLSLLSQGVDIFLSHDWPRNIAYHGDVASLLRRKPHFRAEIESGQLGNPHTEPLLHMLQPRYWFSAHLHVKFPALVQHQKEDATKVTKFLSLDKILPGRDFLQIMDVDDVEGSCRELCYDAEWLAVLRATHDLMSLTQHIPPLPNPQLLLQSVAAERNFITESFGSNLQIPSNFAISAAPHFPGFSRRQAPPNYEVNPQTISLLQSLGLSMLWQHLITPHNPPIPQQPSNPNEIALDSHQEEEQQQQQQQQQCNPDEIALDDF